MSKIKKITPKKAIYNEDETICLQIGWDETGKIEPFPQTIEEVPTTLPKQITSLEFAFSGNENDYIEGIENWDLSNIKSTFSMFSECHIDQDLSDWNTSNVEDMSYMFENAVYFNQDLSNWDTSNVANMSYMFAGAISFNQDLSEWDTSKVEDITHFASPELEKQNWPNFSHLTQYFFNFDDFEELVEYEDEVVPEIDQVVGKWNEKTRYSWDRKEFVKIIRKIIKNIKIFENEAFKFKLYQFMDLAELEEDKLKETLKLSALLISKDPKQQEKGIKNLDKFNEIYEIF
ncbi:Hypothetical protein, DUF285 family [Metamycoplasma alkalescens 14918]|uniref:BspA family leucine-rich repeat surface protein n=1 Tax=Metamycoplasma alkalescens 14918 TaxID=1188234 RepID=N9SQ66_9BACT|nr:BspA family leucine-rich repeat surface protein [Metamycoplasma alkalescens]ENY53625.1 Hypothetical protein, DUF285 family [Metamycoplasma alkalescens 14918]